MQSLAQAARCHPKQAAACRSHTTRGADDTTASGGLRTASWSRSRSGVLAILACVGVMLAGCATNGADGGQTNAGPVAGAAAENLNFERGDLTNWRTLSFGSGAWHVYADGKTPPDPADTDRRVAFSVPAPPEGKFAAVVDMGAPGARILHRKLKLDGRFKLRFTVFYESAGEFFSPPNLDYYLREPNNQFRVDLMDAAAPVTSIAGEHILATIFRTSPGDRRSVRSRVVTFDLSRWAGHTVRIRFAAVDNRGPLRAGVDNLRLQTIALRHGSASPRQRS